MNWIQCVRQALVGTAALVAGLLGSERTTMWSRLSETRMRVSERLAYGGAPRRALAFEPLEPKLPLSAAGLVEVGMQPEGGLSDKIAYIHPGHGWIPGSGYQRPNLLGMIEDLGNYDQMTFFADYLFRAGATVVPLRPLGHQVNEVVLDNDDPGVTFVGGSNWSNSSGSVYYGSPGDVPYRFATTSATETAYARYQPDLPEAGYYPVYSWVTAGGNRAPDQLYRVHHSGGITEVTVNHRRVGNGLVYLGTYYFEAGNNGWVDISNRSNTPGSVVIADMIRFGNGIGASGQTREDEAGLYWIQRHAAPPFAQGISSSEYGTSTVSAPPRYAEYMNRQVDGTLSDRVFVSYHSNAGGGRGVLGLHNTSSGGATPNQLLLARNLAQEVNNDLVAQNGQFEHNWHNRGSNVLYQASFNYGEINNSVINDEFDATIVEVAFHDNQLDAELMRDARVRDAVARATYQGLIKYFRAVDGNTTSATELPAPVTGVRAESNAAGSVTVSWAPPASNSYAGGATTGYRIYASVNGYGFDGGTFIAGGGTNSATLHNYDPSLPYYFKVVAVNEGGESPGSEVVAAIPSGGAKQVLVVNGFDRLDRALNPKQTVSSGPPVDRVRPLESNSRDYVVQVASAIQAAAPGVHVDSSSNEAVISGAVDLTDYDSVIWILGEESTADDTFNATERTKVEQFLAAGGNLFLSGSEIGWDLDAQNNGRAFYENTLLANYISDDANVYTATGASGGIFAGLNVAFDDGDLFYNVDFPDVIAAQPGSQVAMTYGAGASGAAIQAQGTGGRGNLVMLGFPFETITTAANRTAVMDRVLEYFGVTALPTANADFNDDGIVDAADFTVWQDNFGGSVPPGTLGDANGDGTVDAADYTVWRDQFGTSPGAGNAADAASAAASGGTSSAVTAPLKETAPSLSSSSIRSATTDAAFAHLARQRASLRPLTPELRSGDDGVIRTSRVRIDRANLLLAMFGSAAEASLPHTTPLPNNSVAEVESLVEQEIESDALDPQWSAL